MDSISLEVLIALAALVVVGLVYFATVQRNRMQADETLDASERLAVRTRIIDQYASNVGKTLAPIYSRLLAFLSCVLTRKFAM